MPERPLYALLLPPGARLVAGVAAALDGSGPAVAPLDPAAPAASIRRLLAALRPAAVVTPAGAQPYEDAVPVDATTAAVVTTSGSTGEPKAVELPAAALLASARATLSRVDARPGDRWLLALPPWQVAGLQVIVRSLVAGTDPVMLPRFTVDGVAEHAAEYTALVPTMLRRLLGAGMDLSGFRTVLLGGAAPPAGLLAAARAAGMRVVTTYGMTETCGGCVYDGEPLAGVRVAVDADGAIRVTGPVLASGYRLRPEWTGRSFAGGWFHTNDLGRLTADGRLEVLGRADDVVVTGGEKVAPQVVADLLSTHPAVAEVAVLGRPDPEWGHRVVAVVVPTDPTAPPTLADLRRHVGQRAPRHLAPRELLLVERIPVLASGKPDRAALAGLAPPT